MDWLYWQGKIIAGFQILMAALLAWAGKVTIKKIDPTWKAIKRYPKLPEEIEQLKKKIHENERQTQILHNEVRAVLKMVNKPVFITDVKGEMIFANDDWLEMTGFNDPAEAYGRGYIKAIPIEDRKSLEEISSALVKHPTTFNGEVKFRHIRTGKIINTICRTQLICDYENNFYLTIGWLEILNE